MIDPITLTIGSHINVGGERVMVWKIANTSLVTYIKPDGYWSSCDPAEVWVEPIPITEELLTELGFEKAPFKSYRRDLGESEPFMHFHYIADGRWRMEVSDDTRNYGNIVCEYLHQAESFLSLTTKTELIKE